VASGEAGPAALTPAQSIARDTGVATWATLAPHAARGGLLWVEGAPLEEVALAVAADDAARVQGWLSSGALRRAAPEPLDAPGYRFTIVQPFVLAAPLRVGSDAPAGGR